MDHFGYLYEDESSGFFQDLSCEITDDALPRASEPMAKTAAAASLEVFSFEKVAARLDKDLFILKTAGECGVNVGMSKRASAYVDQLLDDCGMTPEQFEDLFDKVAGEAIEIDLMTAHAEFRKLAGDDAGMCAVVDEEIGWLGVEMVKLAHLEKEAILAGLRALFAAGRAGAGALAKKTVRGIGKGYTGIGKGVRALGRGVKAAPGAIARGIAAPFKATARGFRRARLGLAERRMRGMSRALAKPGGLARTPGAAGSAYRKSLQASRAKEQARIGKMMKDPKYQAAAKQRRMARKTEAAARKKDVRTRQESKVKKTQAETEASRRTAKTEAETAATKPVGPEGPAAAAPAEGTLGSAWKKFRESGWDSLTGMEKLKLGGAGVIGSRVVTGHGALTGGEGII